jgi:MFS family permease
MCPAPLLRRRTTQMPPRRGSHGIELAVRGDSDASESDARGEKGELSPSAEPPIPWLSLVALSVAQLSSALVVTTAFPIVAPMSSKLLDLPIEHSATYAGLLASSFMYGRVVTSLMWGWLSDFWGRKPVIILCTILSILANVGFGMSTSFPMAVAMRFLSGLMNGVVGVAKAVTGEIVPTAGQQAVAMAAITTAWSCGIVLGPVVGGYLQGVGPLGDTFPWLLPTLVVGVAGAVGVLATWVYLPETLPPHKRKSCPRFLACCALGATPLPSTDPSVDRPALAPIQPAPGDVVTGPLMCRYRVAMVIIIYAAFSCSSMLVDESFPVWALVQPQYGGLGLDPAGVATILAITGLTMIVLQVTVLPRIVKRIPSKTLLVWFAIAQVPVILFYPVVNALAIEPGRGTVPPPEVAVDTHDAPPQLGVTVAWDTVAVITACSVIAIFRLFFGLFVFTANAVFVNSSVSDSERGAVNGLAMSLGSIGKAAGPTIGGAILTWSLLATGTGWAPFVLSAVMNAGCAVVAHFGIPTALNEPFNVRAKKHAQAVARLAGESESDSDGQNLLDALESSRFTSISERLVEVDDTDAESAILGPNEVVVPSSGSDSTSSE